MTLTNTHKATPSNPLEMVRLFNTSGRQTIRTEPVFDIPEKKLRFSLIFEELMEMVRDGFKADSLIEVVDACADTVYVAAGAALTHGLDIEIRRGIPAIELDFADKDMHGIFVAEANQLAYRLLKVKDTEELSEMLEEIIEFCYLVSNAYGINLDAIIQEVQDSNMSKFLDDGSPLLNDMGKIMKGPNYFRPNLPRVLEELGVKIS